MQWSRIKLLGSWISELRYLVFAVIIVCLAFAIIHGFGFTEWVIRLMGLSLQVLGIGTIIWGISETRKFFDHQPISRRIKRWLWRFPLIRRTANLSSEGIQVSDSLVRGRINHIFKAIPDGSIENRIENIEKGLEEIQKRIERAEKQMDRGFDYCEGRIKAEARKREASDHEVLNTLEYASTGGIYISAIGALWLFVGVILSSASPEISAWLN